MKIPQDSELNFQLKFTCTLLFACGKIMQCIVSCVLFTQWQFLSAAATMTVWMADPVKWAPRMNLRFAPTVIPDLRGLCATVSFWRPLFCLCAGPPRKLKCLLTRMTANINLSVFPSFFILGFWRDETQLWIKLPWNCLFLFFTSAVMSSTDDECGGCHNNGSCTVYFLPSDANYTEDSSGDFEWGENPETQLTIARCSCAGPWVGRNCESEKKKISISDRPHWDLGGQEMQNFFSLFEVAAPRCDVAMEGCYGGRCEFHEEWEGFYCRGCPRVQKGFFCVRDLISLHFLVFRDFKCQKCSAGLCCADWVSFLFPFQCQMSLEVSVFKSHFAVGCCTWPQPEKT